MNSKYVPNNKSVIRYKKAGYDPAFFYLLCAPYLNTELQQIQISLGYLTVFKNFKYGCATNCSASKIGM